MSYCRLSETQVLDAFNDGISEKWSNGAGYNAMKKYNSYEIGVAYTRDKEGKYIITSVWTRKGRR